MALRKAIAGGASSLASSVAPATIISARFISNASGEVDYRNELVSGRIGMPVKRSLFTVNQSPHVDKKSREQFKVEVKKEIVVMKVPNDQLARKLFWLKRRKDFGTLEVKINVETRFPKERSDLYQRG